MWRPALSSLVLLTVLAGGCSGSSSEDAPPPPDVDEDAVVTGLARLYAGSGEGDADPADADCFARGLVDATTPAQLQDAGLLDASYDVVGVVPRLPEDVAAAWVDAQFDCVDFVAESARAQVAASKGAIDAAAYEDCLRGATTDAELRAAVAQALSGDLTGDAVARLSEAQLTCATPTAP